LESQEGVLYFLSVMLSVISTLYSTTLQIIQNCQTLQCFLSPLYVPGYGGGAIDTQPGIFLL
jgi:hypothetical protein